MLALLEQIEQEQNELSMEAASNPVNGSGRFSNQELHRLELARQSRRKSMRSQLRTVSSHDELLVTNSGTQANDEAVITPTNTMKETCNVCLEQMTDDNLKAYYESVFNSSFRQGNRWCSEHFTCLSCQKVYVEHCIMDGKIVIPCTAGPGACSYQVQNQLVVELVGKSLLEKLKETRRRKEFAFCCEKCNNDQFKLAPFDEKLQNCRTFLCKGCKTEYCLFCRYRLASKWEKLGNSFALGRRERRDTYVTHICQDQEARKLAEHVLDETNMIRPCPHCFKFTHRYEGCPNMQCNGVLGCQKLWCWVCLSPTNHSSSACNAVLHPRSGAQVALASCEKGLGKAVTAIGKTAKAGLKLAAFPVLAYQLYKERMEAQRISLAERLVHDGIDVFILPDEISNHQDDPLDDHQAVEFIEEFAVDTGGNGRWGSPNSHRCYLSYNCFDNGNIVVRLHSHGSNVATCPLRAGITNSVSVFINRVQTYRQESRRAQVQASCRRVVAKLGTQSLI
jgi:hypothetical protein